MKKIALLCVFVWVSILPLSAQEWAKGKDGVFEFNCDLINDIIEDYGDEDFVRYEGKDSELAGFFEELVPDCLATDAEEESKVAGDVEFSVIVNGNINLRSCAGTNCDVVGQATDGSVLEVIGQEEDWYEVIFDGETAFIASWLTTRGPDAVIETGERYMIESNGCIVVPDAKRGDMDVNVIITGDRLNDTVVDLYRPNDQYALQVDTQLDKTFIDTGDVYIHQLYRWNVSFPTGLYTIEVTLDDETARIGWNVTERAQYNVYVLCS